MYSLPFFSLIPDCYRALQSIFRIVALLISKTKTFNFSSHYIVTVLGSIPLVLPQGSFFGGTGTYGQKKKQTETFSYFTTELSIEKQVRYIGTVRIRIINSELTLPSIIQHAVGIIILVVAGVKVG